MSLADQLWCPTSVQVTVIQARGLKIKGKGGTNDAFAVMQVGKEKYQTTVAEKSVAPVWKEEATFDLPQQLHQPGGGGGTERSTLHVHVLHRALVGPDKLLGQAVINLPQLSQDKTRSKTEWFKLLDKTGKADKDRGEVLVDVQFLRNNITASMFDLSAAGKSKSRLGKFKDKVRGKKKDSDVASTAAPSFPQVLTDSEDEEGLGGSQAAAGKEEVKKKKKIKSLFSTKSNLQRNMSQSMSVLPAKNSLGGSQSSGLNVDTSEGKKKFKFMIHKRSGSSGAKDSSSAQQAAAEPSNLCINGSHVYRDEPQNRTSRIGSNFSLASSGHGSMEDVPGSSPPSVDSLRTTRQYSPWTEEEEEEEEEISESVKEGEEETGVEKEKVVVEGEEEKRRMDEEENARRMAEERVLEEEKRRQEEEKRREDEKQRWHNEEKARREEEIIRVEEERRKEEKRRLEEEERRLEEEKARKEEEKRKKEERRRLEEEERKQREEKAREEEDRRKEMERRVEEEERRLEEMARKEEDRKKEIERKRIEEEEARKEEEMRNELERRMEEEERARKEEEMRELECRRVEEEERARKEEEMRKELECRRVEEEERARKEEEMRKELERRRVEEEERARKEEEMRKELERRRVEEEERARKEEEMRNELERSRMEEEEKRCEEHARKEEDRRKLEEEEKSRIEEESFKKEMLDRQKQETVMQMEEQNRYQEEDKKEEKARNDEEEYVRMIKEMKKQEEEKREKGIIEERIKEEDERIRKEEKEREDERLLAVNTEEVEKKTKNFPSEEQMKNMREIRTDVVASLNPFDENFQGNPSLAAGTRTSKASVCSDPHRTQPAASLLRPRTSSSDDRDHGGSQREKRPAPQPPGSTDITAVLPQSSSQAQSPVSRSDPQKTSTQTSSLTVTVNPAHHGKGPAPARPCSGAKTSPTTNISKPQSSEVKQEPISYGYNPFEDDDDDEANSHAKIKSSKKVRAPPLPELSDTSSTSVSLSPGGDPGPAVTDPDNRGAHLRDACNVSEVKPVTPQLSGGKKDEPPTTKRRLLPVKPLNSLRQSVNQGEKDIKAIGILSDEAKNTKVDPELKGPYSQLTKAELISLVLKQKKQLLEKDAKISELEQYIDNLLVRVMEEQPSILMSMNSLKKSV